MGNYIAKFTKTKIDRMSKFGCAYSFQCIYHKHGDQVQVIGASRGGKTTKIHVLVNENFRLINVIKSRNIVELFFSNAL